MESIGSAPPLHRAQAAGAARSTPELLYRLSSRLAPGLAALALALALPGLHAALFGPMPDAEQGDASRILYLHVPAAWMSLLLYLALGTAALGAFTLQRRTLFMLIHAIAPTGTMFTFVALWSGAVWGKPTWGAWWVWDARLSSELLLLFMYLAIVAAHAAIDDLRRADRVCGILALVGTVNVPVIFFSVQWWNTLHEGRSFALAMQGEMPPSVRAGIVLMFAACLAYAAATCLLRLRNVILERERNRQWTLRVEKTADAMD